MFQQTQLIGKLIYEKRVIFSYGQYIEMSIAYKKLSLSFLCFYILKEMWLFIFLRQIERKDKFRPDAFRTYHVNVFVVSLNNLFRNRKS